jgi:hypothetical protein
MNPEVVEFIRLTSQFSVILPLILYFRRVSDHPMQNHVIGAAIILSGLTDFISLYIGSPVLFNVFDLVQFILMTWFFYELIYKKRHTYVAPIGVAIYLAVLVFSILKYGLYSNYPGVWIVGSLIIFIHTFFYVFGIPGMIIERYLDKNLLSNIIFNTSIFVYFLVALIVFFLFVPVSKTEDLNAFKEFWAVHNAFNTVKNVGFAFAFYYTGKRSVYITLEQLERIGRKLEAGKEKD